MRLGVIVTVAIGGFFALLPQSRGFRRALLILPILWASLAFRMQFLDRPVRPPDTWTTVPAEAGRYPAVRVAVALGDEVTAGLFLARVEHFV